MTPEQKQVIERSIQNLSELSINFNKAGIPSGGIDEVRQDLESII